MKSFGKKKFQPAPKKPDPTLEQKPEPTLEQKLTAANQEKTSGERLLAAATNALDSAVERLDEVHDEITAEISRLGLLADTASAQAVSAQIKADGARQIG